MAGGGTEGRLVDGRFELLEPLGGGGMGLVWRARDTMLQREVALKEVRFADQATLEGDPAAAHVLRERVLREARALARLHHVNVVTIYHIVDAPDIAHPWLVMELVQGGSLQDRLKAGTLSVPEAVRIARGVLAALRAAHAAGIEHRDVKPGNVLLRPDGTPVLTDFGIAALHSEPGLTATGLLIGSPEYMAPERIRGREGDPASDLWSLGMLLYVALEGRNPLRRETSLATLAAVLDEPIPAPVRSGPLAPVLAALLARDPGYRPDGATLDRMLAEAEYGAVAAYGPPPQAQHVDPRTATTAYGESPTRYGESPTAYGGSPNAYGESPTTQRFEPAYQRTTSRVDVIPDARPALRKGGVAAWAVGMVAVGVAGVLAWTLHGSPGTPNGNIAGGPNTSSSTSLSASTTSTASTASTKSISPTNAPAAAAQQDLLSPAGIRALIANTLKPAMGAPKVTSMRIYTDHAQAYGPSKSDPKLSDDFSFTNGELTVSPDDTIDAGTPLIDLDAVNWDALPALFDAAHKQLNIPKPDYGYIWMDNDWMTYGKVFKVYLTDAYGGAYLVADLQGHVLKINPR